jgi:Ca2+-binding RTX toxin-like protein
MANIYDVRDFGARGDGVTDDTAAIQAAIDAASANEGSRVYLPGSTYLVSPSDAADGGGLALKSGVFLQGDGISATVIRMAPGVADVPGVVRVVGGFVGARDLTIDGGGQGASGQVDGWVSGPNDDVFLDGVAVSHASGYGFDLRGTDNTFNLVNCVARSNGLDGVISDGQENSYVHDSVAANNNGNGFNITGAIEVLDSDAYGNRQAGMLFQEGAEPNTTNIRVDGGVMHDNGGDGVEMTSVSGYSVNGVESYANVGYGIDNNSSRNGSITYNQVHGNALDPEGGAIEIDVQGWDQVASVTAENVTVMGNIVTGGPNSFYGIVEPIDSGDYNTITDNVVSATDWAVTVTGDHSIDRNNDYFVLQYGTPAADRLRADITADQLYGGAGNDRLDAGAGNDALVGGAGVDRMTGGAGADVFRFGSLLDSYRTASTGHADRISDFTVGQDRLDLTPLGLTGLGNGHGSTLKLSYSAASDLTYLKSFDADANGNRFELALQGHYTALSTGSFQWLTEGQDHSSGVALAETIIGTANRDTLAGAAGDDRLSGSTGGDTLTGGAGLDTFVYTHLSDSLRSNVPNGTVGRDTLVDFDGSAGDQIDVSALGFTGFGDGSGTSLKVAVSADGSQTVLKSNLADAFAKHFELLLQGDHASDLTDTSVIFAHAYGTTPTSSAPSQDLNYSGTAGRDVLVGNSGDNLIQGDSGADRLRGGVGEDVLIGGSGADLISGDTGEDIYRYAQTSDSYRDASHTFTDTLTDFNVHDDRIDVSALGFTGLGDGHNGTLQVALFANPDRTYLRSLDDDAQGRRFEIHIGADVQATIGAANFIFADASTQADNLTLLGMSPDVMA